MWVELIVLLFVSITFMLFLPTGRTLAHLVLKYAQCHVQPESPMTWLVAAELFVVDNQWYTGKLCLFLTMALPSCQAFGLNLLSLPPSLFFRVASSLCPVFLTLNILLS